MMLPVLPQGFSERAPTLEDAGDVAALGQLCDKADRRSSGMTREQLLRNWFLPGVELSRDIKLVFAPDHRLVGYAKLVHRELPQLYATPLVHPDYARSTLYSYLFAWIEQQAREFIPLAPAEARVALNTFGVEKNQQSLQAIEQAGFVYVRSAFRMQIDMDAPPPAPQWPEGIALRPFTQEMARAVHIADEEAFSDHWGHVPSSFEIFEHWFMHSPSFDPTLWFLPCEGEQIAGCALCEYRGKLGWVGSLSVRRPWRRRGLALALLYALFGEFYRRGTRQVALDVDAQSLTGATHLYEKAGMRVVFQENQYQKELRSGIELSTQTLKI